MCVCGNTCYGIFIGDFFWHDAYYRSNQCVKIKLENMQKLFYLTSRDAKTERRESCGL